MAPSKSSIDIAALARKSLQHARTPTDPQSPGPAASASNVGENPTSTEDLIATYFLCEEPDERDLVFEALKDRPLSEVAPFFLAMAQHDQDPILRIQAAAHLAEKNVVGAWDQLETELQKTEDATLVEEVLLAAAEADAPRVFSWAEQVFCDPRRTSRVRCSAMRAMTTIDAARATPLFLARLPEWLGQAAPPQDLIERALSSIASDKTPGASVSIQRMLDGLTKRKDAVFSDSIREDLCSMLDESRLLLELD